MKESIFINKLIHKKAKISKAEFLRRVANVKAIRTEQCPCYKVTFRAYIQDAYDWQAVEYLSSAIQKGDFSGIQSFMDGEHVFGLIVSDEIAKWLKGCPGSVAQRQIVTWLSYLWAMDPGREDVLRDQLFPPVFDEAKQLYDRFFSNGNSDGPSSEKDFHELELQYLEACCFYYGSRPPEILACPPHSLGTNQYSEVRSRWGFEADMFEFTVRTFYFTDADWKEVVIKEGSDALRRAESREDVWAQWKSAFIREEHEFAMYQDGDRRGVIYLIEEEETKHIKIGFTSSSNAEKRLAALQTGNSNKLSIVGQFQCASSFAERSLHELFRDKRLQGEWFGLTEKDVANILNPEWRALKFVL